MAFEIKIVCDFCGGDGLIQIDKGNVFIICEDCGQEREIKES